MSINATPVLTRELPAEWKGMGHHELNAMLNLFGADGSIQFAADKEAARQYFLESVNNNTKFFHDLEEKVDYLIKEQYWEKETFDQYNWDFVKSLFKRAYAHKFRFETFLGAFKFYTAYAMKTFDGKRFLERYEDRVAMVALHLSRGNEAMAERLVDEIILGRFQPATPTFLNSGKAQRGELVSCFLLRTEDNLESIFKSVSESGQLSKRGGGVAVSLTNLRESGSPIKKVENQSSGVIPVMKLLEDTFSYVDQLGQRQGAGAVYLHAHHPDILRFLDTKRENADEKIRIKTLSLGVVVPDITFELARLNKDMYLFSPYDVKNVYGVPMTEISVSEKYEEMVDDARIKKTKISAREFFQTIAEIQFESGYPYILFEDTANKANQIEGRVSMSNLCVTGDTEILTAGGYRNVLDLYKSQEDFDVVVDARARDMDPLNVGMSVEKSTKMIRTAEHAEIFKLTTSGGNSLRATEWHKFYVLRQGVLSKIPMNEVVPGDFLPVIGAVINFDDFDVSGAAQWNFSDDSVDQAWDYVLSIEPDGIEDVYDVTVENGNSVIFNGIATGNCSEILQVSTPSTYNESGEYDTVGQDISCNLGSLNIAKVMDSGDLGGVVESAIRALTAVSDMSNIRAVPSVAMGNANSRAIGLGQMNLHGYLGREHVHYGSEEGIEFTSAYFAAVAYYAVRASNKLAIETGSPFTGFETSGYADGSYFDKYTEKSWLPTSARVRELFATKNITLPHAEDWKALRASVMEHGLYNAYLQAVPPTGSISYINNSTSSIHPIASQIEIRKEGKIGRVYYPAPHMDMENREFFQDAYEIGYEKIIDTYAAATEHVDQGLSLTLFFKDTATTRDINKAQIYAWRKGIKSLYYIRIRQMALEGTEVDNCVSCTL